MKYTLLALALGLALAPVVASAQPGPGPGGPPPELRAKIEQARADAKTNCLKALSADHQTKIQAIVDGFNAGTIAPPDAIAQIDGVLTPDEIKAILDQQQKMRDVIIAARGDNGGPPPGERNAGAREKPAGFKPSAGRFLLEITASPDKLREVMKAMREHNKPQ